MTKGGGGGGRGGLVLAWGLPQAVGGGGFGIFSVGGFCGMTALVGTKPTGLPQKSSLGVEVMAGRETEKLLIDLLSLAGGVFAAGFLSPSSVEETAAALRFRLAKKAFFSCFVIFFHSSGGIGSFPLSSPPVPFPFRLLLPFLPFFPLLSVLVAETFLDAEPPLSVSVLLWHQLVFTDCRNSAKVIVRLVG